MKRNLVREATLKVIEKRLEQSKAILFVHSQNSIESVWCKYELNYFAETDKPIYQINIGDLENDNYDITAMISKWYVDKDYKNLALLN